MGEETTIKLKVLRKWNYESRTYDEYYVPYEWNIKLLTNDMDEIINCPHCGKEFPYGESYTSKEIHNKVGFGYPVCSDCYEEEWERKRKSDRDYLEQRTNEESN